MSHVVLGAGGRLRGRSNSHTVYDQQYSSVGARVPGSTVAALATDGYNLQQYCPRFDAARPTLPGWRVSTAGASWTLLDLPRRRRAFTLHWEAIHRTWCARRVLSTSPTAHAMPGARVLLPK